MDITATAGGISIGTTGTTTATIIIIATKPEETRRGGTRRRPQKKRENGRARIETDPRFCFETFSAQRPKADCKWPVTLPLFSGQKGYAGTRNQRRAAYTP
jgi:hypothetical protein